MEAVAVVVVVANAVAATLADKLLSEFQLVALLLQLLPLSY